MPIEDEEKTLLEKFRKLQSSSKHIALAQIIAAANFEENARKLYLGQH